VSSGRYFGRHSTSTQPCRSKNKNLVPETQTPTFIVMLDYYFPLSNCLAHTSRQARHFYIHSTAIRFPSHPHLPVPASVIHTHMPISLQPVSASPLALLFTPILRRSTFSFPCSGISCQRHDQRMRFAWRAIRPVALGRTSQGYIVPIGLDPLAYMA